MALNFPTSPELNQVYTSGTRSWRWDGSSWVANNSVTNILGYIPVNKAGDTMSGGLNVPNVNAVTVTANSGGFSIAGGSSASKTLTVSNSVTVSGTDGSTLNIGAGGTLQSGAFQASSQGATGATGAQGTTGAQGATGTQGALGTQGSTGAQGTVGGAGIQGATGSQGATGTAGAQGTQGTNGSQGTSGSTGAQGSTGTQGAVGSTGGTGATGSTGVQGSTGAQGATGSTGSTGATGAQGTSGATILGSNNTWTGTNAFNGGGITSSATNNAIQLGSLTTGNVIATNGGGTSYLNINISAAKETGKSEWNFSHASAFSAASSWDFTAVETGNTYSRTSSRAPIFYDSDNTAYWIDPAASTSLNIAGGITIAAANPSITASSYITMSGGAYFSSGTVYAEAAIQARGGISNDSGSALTLNGGTGGYTNISGSARSPLFYDSNNTGYYCDPASTSNINAITIAGQINQTGPGRTTTISTSNYDSKIGSSDLYLYTKSIEGGSYPVALQIFRVSDAVAVWTLALQPAGGNVTIGSYSDLGQKLNVNGVGYSNSSWRAPIFYDSDNTAFYVNPDSDSNFNGWTYSGQFYSRGWFRNEGAQGLYNSSYGNHFYATSDTYWNIAGNSASVTGLMMRTGGHQGTVRGYLYGDSSNNFGLLGSTGGWRLRIVENDWVLIDGSSIRAQLFYDTNNTGYYLDPASTSELNRINTVRSSNWIYMDNHYGDSLVGAYASTIFQGVFAMGDSYKLTQGGGINNLYGICWSHPNAGGIAGNLDSHGLIVAINGGFGSCMAYSIKASSNVTAYSDERLKKDWADLPKNYVEQLAKVKVGTYTRIDGEKLRQVGVSAQSLKPLLPEAVIEATDDFKTLSVAYGNAAMASAVELAKEVVTLKEQLNIVMERLKQLENK